MIWIYSIIYILYIYIFVCLNIVYNRIYTQKENPRQKGCYRLVFSGMADGSLRFTKWILTSPASWSPFHTKVDLSNRLWKVHLFDMYSGGIGIYYFEYNPMIFHSRLLWFCQQLTSREVDFFFLEGSFVGRFVRWKNHVLQCCTVHLLTSFFNKMGWREGMVLVEPSEG